MATPRGRQQLSNIENTCGMLLNELQLIWDEVGESNEDRDQMLLDIEQECLQVYHRKVDEANRLRTTLHQLLADIHSQIVSFASALGDLPPVSQLENRGCPLKEQLAQLKPILDEMSRKKDERLRVLQEIRAQIQSIQREICPSAPLMEIPIHEKDLTQRKLEELQTQLQILHKEKEDRLLKVEKYLESIHELCMVLGCDFFSTVRAVNPTLDESTNNNQDKSISNETIGRLESTIQTLKEEKRRKMQQIQDIAASLLELWNLMDTPLEEQHEFHHVTCNIAAEEDEIVAAGVLSEAVIEQAALEVERLENLKASKMKELVLKKRNDMEELCRKAHIIPDSYIALDNSIESMEAGLVDPEELLATIEEKIGCIKEEAFSRREIMEKVEKWMGACEEESWLEDYNKDENRYSATRGAHLNLKRAERARAAVNKIPAMVEALIVKTTAWEEERGKPFLYDGVRLLSTIEEYNILRIGKEEERRRQRDQKRLHEQLVNEQETLFGTRQSPNGKTPLRKGATPSRMNGNGTPASRRMSIGGAMLHETPAIGRMNGATPRPVITHGDMIHTRDGLTSRRVTQTPAQVNRVLLPDEDNIPHQGREEGLTSNRRVTQTPGSVSRVLLHDDDNLSPHGNKFQPGQVTDSPTRVPFSPVTAPQHRVNTNTNTEESQASSAVVKAANNIKSPLSSAALLNKSSTKTTAVLDGENATPPNLAASPQEAHTQQLNVEPFLLSVPNVEPCLTFPTNPQVVHRPQEYSFEEKRLAFMFHHHQSYVSPVCR